MKSKIAQRIMEDTPEYIKAKVKQYGKQKMKQVKDDPEPNEIGMGAKPPKRPKKIDKLIELKAFVITSLIVWIGIICYHFNSVNPQVFYKLFEYFIILIIIAFIYAIVYFCTYWYYDN
jgi:hypothetical protein